MEPNFLFTVCPASFQEFSTRILRAENLTLSTKILVHDANYLFFIYLINTIGLSMCSLHISWTLSFCGCHGAAWWYVQLWLHGLQMLPHCHLCKLYFRVTRLMKHRMLRKAVLDLRSRIFQHWLKYGLYLDHCMTVWHINLTYTFSMKYFVSGYHKLLISNDFLDVPVCLSPHP